MLEVEETTTPDDDQEILDLLKREEKERARSAKRPSIDHLDDAISLNDEGFPQFNLNVDDSLIIERYTQFGDKPRWFDTKVYRVLFTNVETGALRLFDLENKNYAASNYISGFTNPLYKFKIAPLKTNKLKRRGKHDAKSNVIEKETKTKKPRKVSVDGKMRKVYESRGTIHTRIGGVPYGPSGKTKAHANDKLMMTLNSQGLTVKDTAQGWSEVWEIIKL